VAGFPIVLELGGRPCLVVGGGPVAERKVEILLAADARVTVVSPRLTRRLQAWVDSRAIRHIAGEYRPGDVQGHALVFVASDDPALTATVVAEARALHTWVNAADDPARCDFTLPSVLRRGELTVAVSTGGTSPALARSIREELEDYFTDEYRVLAGVAAEARRELRRRGRAPDAETWRRALKTLLADDGLRPR
jgi:precorrin-2 dehydrogenase / sirohydrochlorin ferrochelatase